MIAGSNTLDIVLLIILTLSILFGILRGFIKELFSLAFFILALILAFLYYHEVGTLFGERLSRNIANFAGFLTIFVIILIVGALVTYFVKKLFVLGPLRAVDRILGGVFGLVRGILIVALVVFVMIAFEFNDRLIQTSRLSPYVLETIKTVFKLTPEKFKEKKDAFINEHIRQKAG